MGERIDAQLTWCCCVTPSFGGGCKVVFLDLDLERLFPPRVDDSERVLPGNLLLVLLDLRVFPKCSRSRRR